MREGWCQILKRIGEPHLRFMRRLMKLPDWCNETREVLLAKACNCIWNLESGSTRYENMVTKVSQLCKATYII